MEVLIVLIPVSIVLAAGSVVACLFAIRGGQFDDLESPPWRILFEDRKATGVPLVSEPSLPVGSGGSLQNANRVLNKVNVTETDTSLSANARRSAPI